MPQISKTSVEAYARAWRANQQPHRLGVTDEERQVALVLLGYDTLQHRNAMGISEEARAYAAAHWPDGFSSEEN